MDWNSKQEGMQQIRITGFSKGRIDLKGEDLHVLWRDFPYSWNGGHPGAMAVHNGILVFSVFGPGRIFFYDTSQVTATRQAEMMAEVPVGEPNAIAFDSHGRLLVIDGTRLLRYTLKDFPNPLSSPETLIAEGLDTPRSMTLDSEDRIYIAEWGKSHQVKVFNPEGKFLRAVGHPGGPVEGPYDPERMAFPYGLSVDSEGKLWLGSRRWWTPKVIWVWDKDGRHVRNHYGPTQYGGGGFLDPKNRSRMLYHDGNGGTQFKIDWEKGTGVPVSLYQFSVGARNDRWDFETPLLNFRDGDPSFPYRARGRSYISNSYTGMANGPVKVFLLSDLTPERCPPLLLATPAGAYEAQLRKLGLWDKLPFAGEKNPAKAHAGAYKTLCIWSDHNGDGVPQAEEFQFGIPDPLWDARKKDFGAKAGIIFNIELGRDLDLLVRYDGKDEPGGVLRFRPAEVKENGMPLYDLTRYEKVLETPFLRNDACTNVHQFEDGRLVLTGGPIAGFSADGKPQWIYHSEWPGLHAGHAAPRAPQFSGQLIATTHMIGDSFTPKAGEAGPLWALNCNLGLVYLFTADGLLVDTLFNYRNGARLWNFPEHGRGMDVTDVNIIDENFHPTITQFEDGSVYLNAGKTSASLVKVNGLESIRRFSGSPLTISAADVARITEFNRDLAARERSRQGSSELRLNKASNVTADGKLDDWADPQWVTVQRERFGAGFGGRDVDYTQAALAYDDRNLYVAVRSRGRNILQNAGGPPSELFTTGGGLDIHLATKDAGVGRKKPVEGDVRLIIVQVGKEIKAVRFRPVVPGTKDPVEYFSTVAQTSVDRVEDVSGRIQVGIGSVKIPDRDKEATLEQVEVVIPLEVLGWNPKTLPKTLGDIGILTGDGGKTVSRIYWHNKATGLVSDIPSEARLEPSMWGAWKCEK